MISTAELRYAMVRLGEKVTEREVEDMIRQVDLNRDGLMNYEGICLPPAYAVEVMFSSCVCVCVSVCLSVWAITFE